MRRLALSVALGLLLAASLAIKVYGRAALAGSADDVGDQDIVALLQKHGFQTWRAATDTDPVWVHGTRNGCQIDIAGVSPQGWHRAIVDWHAAGKRLQYSAMGELRDQQPMLKPMMVHYLARLQRYAGIGAPEVKIRAIVITPGCPADVVPPAELAALSD
ncbi:hypothetical protein MesoLjLc_20190 [Mesorhizobium sp. L-8-10]|uniref:hypothetical protein n=1 Tax=Mesorhizobium sp. L-8-10 TaxID=2744523 RepID=UPI0019285DBD|nr:hypothetical protein [Mesorhizobium sp. L-8-10]BCH30089.1 hypothetical protein MesoLjLc_20190 [Mesorhizobium sp. L-8-10]